MIGELGFFTNSWLSIGFADRLSGLIIVLMALWVGFWLLFRHKQKLLDFWLALIVSGFTSEIIKNFVNAPRPISVHVYEGSSFPSTHTTLAFVVFFFVLNVCHRFSLFRSGLSFQAELKAKLMLLGLGILAIGVGFLRIIAEAHYLIDVIGGVLVAYLVSMLFMYYDVTARRIK